MSLKKASAANITLKVCLFGRFEVWRDGEKLAASDWPQRKAQQLLKLLLTERGRFFTQDQLIENLFADLMPVNAARSVHRRISELRKVLEPDLAKGADSQFVLHAGLKGYAFTKEALCWLDTEAFEHSLEQAQTAESEKDWAKALEHYQSALALYRGDFMAEDLYEEWTLGLRERWRELFLKSLSRLAELQARLRQLEKAIASCERALALQPWHEIIARQKMLYHYHAGESTQALQTYEQCVKALRQQLDMPPSAELQKLKEEILNKTIIPLSPAYETNVPTPLTSFVGREKELNEIKNLFVETLGGNSSFRPRLVTLTGLGGCGKTRLAMQLGSELLQEFSAGVWWVDLVALLDSRLLVNVIAQALGVREKAAQPIRQALLDYLRDKKILLILDNCEHLIEACAEVTETLLRSCRHLRMLTTSREALDLEGEYVWPVQPLTVPDIDAVESPEALERYESVQLFAERARARQFHFSLSQANSPTLARLCQQLEGLPLAIELAASRLTTLSLEEIEARLSDRFSILTSRRRTSMPQHHLTLQAAMDWSWELLSLPEQMLLSRLSVFAGGFTLESVLAVCAPAEKISEASETSDLLTRLVEKSLVIAERKQSATRYRLLETVRQYAQEKLRLFYKEEETRLRHLDWFCTLAERAESELSGVNQREWLDRLEQEHDNLRAALGRSVENNQGEKGLRLAVALWRFWHTRGYLSEGRRWIEAMLAVNASTPSLLRARALESMGAMLMIEGAYEIARSFHTQSLALCQELGDRRGIGAAFNHLGLIAEKQGDFSAAHKFYEKSLDLLRALGDKEHLAQVLCNFAGLPTLKEARQSSALFEESLALFRELGDKQNEALVLGHLGLLANKQGDFTAARTYHSENLAISKELGDKRSMAAALNNLGLAAYNQGDYEAARALYYEGLSIVQEIGDKPGIAVMLNNLGRVAASQEDFIAARSFYEESLQLRQEMGNKPGIALLLNNLGQLACLQKEYEKAKRLHQQSLLLAQEIGSKQNTVSSIEGLAAVSTGQREFERALQLWGAADALREAQKIMREAADRIKYEKSLAFIKTNLELSRFNAVLSHGRAMKLEEVTAFALALNKV